MPEVLKSLKKVSTPHFRWLHTGEQALSEMLIAVGAAQRSIRLEMYIFHESNIAEKFRVALLNACQRNVRVHVMVDALGSITLPTSFWDPLKKSGGDFRWFNPLTVHRFSVRDHRKMLVCDDEVAFVGGFNISKEYQGDGVVSGWRDLGLKIYGPLVRELAGAFDDLFAVADSKQGLFQKFRKPQQQRLVSSSEADLLLTSPGRQHNPIKRFLRDDLRNAKSVQIIAAYFLPTWRLRRDLMRVAREGGKVQLILPGKSDIGMMQAASRSLYRRLLHAGVEIYEYQPQILHAKLIVIDGVAYAGSSNLDTRSLHLNYELLVRFNQANVVAEARNIFKHDLRHCLPIQLAEWNKTRPFWTRLKQRWAYFLLARLDPYLTRWQLRRLR
ncbi:MAG: Phospholipase D/Transphosphatidylase [Verrucomicrobiales bacterium]|nr:Phospholipase D/Transphosphatidylase [Verrucomicrobiales bacterium]